MKINTKILMDVSSILGGYLRIQDEEYGIDVEYKGEDYHIPDIKTCMKRFRLTFINLLQDTNTKGSDVICVRDPGGPCIPRRNIIPRYKTKDRSAPDELFSLRREFFVEAVDWMKTQGAIVATPKNKAEADDLINEFAKRFKKTLIFTRDKDLLACPTDVLLKGKGTLELNPKRFPVEDKYIPVYRAIVAGDASDNVGSVKGFGVKTWENMIAHFGDSVVADLHDMINDRALDELSYHVEDFPRFQLIIDQAFELYQNYRVMCFFKVPSYEVAWEGGKQDGISALVTKSNYKEAINYIKDTEFDYSVIDYESDSPPEAREWAKQAGIKLDVMGQKITGMGLRINDRNFYFSTNHKDTDNIAIKDLEAILELIYGKPIYAHNASFENTLTYNHFETLLPNMIDTMLMYSYVNEEDYSGLKHLSKLLLGYQQASFEDTLAGKSGMSELTGEEVVSYGLDDVIVTDGIKNLMEVILTYEGTLDVFHKVENDALYFSTLCFINGIDFDQQAYFKLERDNARNIEETWAKLSDALLDLHWPGGEFEEVTNLNIVTVNKLYKTAHGKDLDNITTVKMAIRLMDDAELAELVKNKDFELINKYYKHHWKPVAEFNVRSPKQMCKLLYNVLKIPRRIKNKQTAKMKDENKPGNPASNELAIRTAIFNGDTKEVALLDLLLDYKSSLTKKSLFLDKYPNFVHWKTGRIHASLRQSATTTRRYSCSAPNLQQLPKKAGKEYRNMLRAREGYSFGAFDFSGQELRLAADDSRDPNFLSCYIGDYMKDPHSLTGLDILQKTDNSMTYQKFMHLLRKEDAIAVKYRTLGKKINFTCQYGAMAQKVAQELFITPAEAQKYMDSRESAFPALLKRVKEWHVFCEGKRYAATMLGARRHLHSKEHYGGIKKDAGQSENRKELEVLIASTNKTSKKKKKEEEVEVSPADRLSYSMRIQGSAAEMTKLVCGNLYAKGLLDNGDIIPSTLIHDEVVVQIKDSMIDELVPVITKIMCQQYADMIVPLETEPEIGKNFGSLKPWEGVL